MIVYLTHWFCARDRSRAIACLYAANPAAALIGSPVAGWLLGVHWQSLAGWRWLFILEGVPAIVVGIITYFYMTDQPPQAGWLHQDERDWLVNELQAELQARVILDKSGNVYGTTTFGGTGGLNGGVTDPAEDFPNAVTFDASGNLWGMTEYALFKLSPGTSGWTETWVFNWQNTPGWGTGFTPLIVDSHGIFWGTDTWGGNAFKVVP
jgi:MFS family permease